MLRDDLIITESRAESGLVPQVCAGSGRGVCELGGGGVGGSFAGVYKTTGLYRAHHLRCYLYQTLPFISVCAAVAVLKGDTHSIKYFSINNK